MAVKLRLQRFGQHKRPFYRIVAADAKAPRDGKFLDIVGTYEPIKGDVQVNSEKVAKWIENGAQPTDTVKSLFKKFNISSK
ncbi:30S ribosomal protein S16 [Acholeplasma hippikon]|uniref:Small ribosomal subunit protein bS16 n=1 Tax=Acholeplasma hippikon TaxID=264636 RepID=A0A449BL99_9MOLU|nr:30S ribosomal protein S16 [Acholeplasma hippikon]VEU83193.1 30S ribosomal protein S16 [Acholeplasma hippikon]